MSDLSITVPEVAKKFGLNRNNFYEKLKEFGVQGRAGTRKQKYIANDNAFSKWSHKMAYCLGFIAADGHVWKDRPFLTIGISASDRCILEYIKDFISPESKIRHSNEGIQICIRSQKIWDDLNRLGINNDKTFNLKISFDIPKKYIGDFVRGYFDGDGSIWKNEKRGHYTGSIVSASKQVLIDLQKLIGFGTVRSTHKGKYFVLEFNQTALLKLKDLIYKDRDSVVLHRKYEKFLKIDPKISLWTNNEDNLLLSNFYKKIKDIFYLFPNRSKASIQSRKNFLRKKHGKDKKHYSYW